MCGNVHSHHGEPGAGGGRSWEQRGAEKMLQGKFGEISISSQGETELQQEVERDFPKETTELGKSARKIFESGGVSQPG